MKFNKLDKKISVSKNNPSEGIAFSETWQARRRRTEKISSRKFLCSEKAMSERGFTLVEMIVSAGIFSIVMLIATGAIFSIVDANKKTQGLKSVMTNLNFALESMMRDIRTGYDFSCVANNVAIGDCSAGNTAFQFISNIDDNNDGSNDAVRYSFSGGRIHRNNIAVETSATPITAPEVNITDMKFRVSGSSPSDTLQPLVIITINGSVTIGKSISKFDIQTTVSQRLYDL